MNETRKPSRDDEFVRALLAPLERVQPVTRPETGNRSRRAKRSYVARRLVPVFVLAAAAFAFVLIAPWQHGPGSTVMERALAAIGDRPVLHVVLTQATARTYIDLATGREKPQFTTTEIWYDRERHLVHYKFTSSGHLSELLQTQTGYSTSDHSGSSSGDPYVDPALAGFFDRYRSALESGDARTTGEGKIDGHDVTWIELPSGRGTTERVAVDETSSLPIRIEDRSSAEGTFVTEVTSIETLPAGSGDFSKPKHISRAFTGGLSSIEPIAPTDAPDELPGALWLGETFSTFPLTSLTRATSTVQPVSDTPPLGPTSDPTVETGLRLRYGDGEPGRPGQGYVWLDEAARPDMYFGFFPDTRPPAGGMVIVGDERNWDGWVIENGVHVCIQASSRELLLAAARALRPIADSSSQASP